jgi:hypothetical protein
MGASSTFSYHVSGGVVPQVSVGASSAYVPIGICEDGADIDIQIAAHNVKHDGGGGLDGFEVENIFLNAVCIIRFTLVPFGGSVVNALRARAEAIAGSSASAGPTDGTMVVPGTLYGTNSLLPGLYLPSLDVDGPWWFRTCRVVKAGSNRISTKDTKPQWEFRAINYFNVASINSISTNVLYSRTAPP